MVKKFIPNILTFMNLSLWILSIIEVFNKNFVRAALFIIVATLVDRYDGRIARYF
ncbi:CDP-alcohol phosphatidyltransferase family protein [Clostridium saccharoperbutylacetonicum]